MGAVPPAVSHGDTHSASHRREQRVTWLFTPEADEEPAQPAQLSMLRPPPSADRGGLKRRVRMLGMASGDGGSATSSPSRPCIRKEFDVVSPRHLEENSAGRDLRPHNSNEVFKLPDRFWITARDIPGNVAGRRHQNRRAECDRQAARGARGGWPFSATRPGAGSSPPRLYLFDRPGARGRATADITND